VSFRVTFKLERGSQSGLVKHAIEGQVVEAEQMEIVYGALHLFNLRPTDLVTAPLRKELVIAYSPDTWRTVTPVVGATAQPETPPSENPGRRHQARAPQAS
jgi:hypothetical protein